MAENRVEIIIDAQNRAATALQEAQRMLQNLSGTVVQAGNVQKGLDSIVGQLTSSLSAQSGMVGRVVQAFGLMATPVGLAALAIGSFATAAIVASHAMGEFQQRQDAIVDQLGTSQRELGGYQQAASNVGKAFESIQPSLFQFSRRLGEAQSGNKALAESFKALGVDIFDAGGKARDFDDVLSDVSSALDKTGSVAERNRLLVDLFGRGGISILSFLRQNFKETADEAERSGRTLTESQQKTARDANVAWEQLKSSLTGLKNQFLITLAPVGTAIAQFSLKAVEDFKKMKSSIDEVNEGLKVLHGLGKPVVEIGPITTQGIKTTPTKPGTPEYEGTLSSTAPVFGPQLDESYKKVLDANDAFNQMVRDKAAAREAAEDEYTKMLRAGPRQIQAAGIGQPKTISGTTIKGLAQPDRVLEDYNEQLKANAEIAKLAKDSELGLGKAVEETTAKTKTGTSSWNTLAQNIESGFSRALASSILFGDSLSNIFDQIISEILAKFIESSIVAPILGAIGLHAGGTPVGGATYAQSGVTYMSGTRGRDTIHSIVGAGETTISHETTDKLNRFLDVYPAVMSSKSNQNEASQINVYIPPGAVVVGSGALLDEKKLADIVTDRLASKVENSLRTGRVRFRT